MSGEGQSLWDGQRMKQRAQPPARIASPVAAQLRITLPQSTPPTRQEAGTQEPRKELAVLPDGSQERPQPIHAAEFFAGIGLMRAGLEGSGNFEVVWANDIEPSKRRIYAANHPNDPSDHFFLGDIRTVRAEHLSAVQLATASFPCTDLSLAGDREGLAGGESGTFWEFCRVLRELDDIGGLPSAVLLENVIGFATSHGGADLEAAVEALNALGYVCDVITLDAAWFVPQSRLRMFVIGAQQPSDTDADWTPTRLRPAWVNAFVAQRSHLKMQRLPLPEPPTSTSRFADVVERLGPTNGVWWDHERVGRFVDSLSPVQAARLEDLRTGRILQWRTAYRRTRNGHAVWEMRNDEIAGCLRTARGGSSKQAVVEAGRGRVRVRWMTPREYACLQGVPDYDLDGFRPNEVYFGFGDAVCVPAIEWIADHYLTELFDPAR